MKWIIKNKLKNRERKTMAYRGSMRQQHYKYKSCGQSLSFLSVPAFLLLLRVRGNACVMPTCVPLHPAKTTARSFTPSHSHAFATHFTTFPTPHLYTHISLVKSWLRAFLVIQASTATSSAICLSFSFIKVAQGWCSFGFWKC